MLKKRVALIAQEQKHAQNVIELKKRSDKEIIDYCLKKYAELHKENIDLKKNIIKLI